MRQYKQDFTENEKEYILNNYPNKSMVDIAKYLHADQCRIKYFLINNNIKIRTYKDSSFLADVIEEIKTLYYNQRLSIKEIAKKFDVAPNTLKKHLMKHNIKIRGISETKQTFLSLNEERELVNTYLCGTNILKTCRLYKITHSRCRNILEKHGVNIKKRGNTETKLDGVEQNKLIKVYQTTNSIRTAATSININPITAKKMLIKYGVYKGRIKKDLIKIFKEQFGEKLGLEKYYEFNCTKFGWGCWYKNIFFRSLKELSYIIEIEKQHRRWQKADNLKFNIKYLINSVEFTYYPDFLIDDKYLIEIKPKNQWNNDIVKKKAKAARKFCKQQGLIYELINVAVNNLEIANMYNKNLIIPTHHRKKEFDKKFKFDVNFDYR